MDAPQTHGLSLTAWSIISIQLERVRTVVMGFTSLHTSKPWAYDARSYQVVSKDDLLFARIQ